MKPTIALFVHHPECSVDSCNGIIQALTPTYDFKLFTKDWVEEGFFNNVDIIVFPGGFGDSDRFERLIEKNYPEITAFLNRGGRYLGICMGAYWADQYYFNIVQGFRAVQYIRQPNTDTHRPHAKDMSVTWEGKPMNMFFYDGCAFTGDDFTIVATYPNGDPMAIVQDNLALIGCHPEADKHWYDMYSWMKPKWHGGQHDLLREFVVNFFEK